MLNHAKELGEVNDNIKEIDNTEGVFGAMVKHFRTWQGVNSVQVRF